MATYTYGVTEYDPVRPWIVVSQRTGLQVELDNALSFGTWANENWPGPRYAAQLDPRQMPPMLRWS